MKKLNPDIHYVNKSKTKHYYNNLIMTNDEWSKYIHGEFIQGYKQIYANDKHKKATKLCERWYNQDDHKTAIAKHCPNAPIYKNDLYPMFVCGFCARAISKINPNASFSKIKEKDK